MNDDDSKTDWDRLSTDEIREKLAHASDAVLRDWYEHESRRKDFDACNGQSTIAVVIRMVSDYLSGFESVLDIGCGCDLACDFFLEEQHKSVTGIDLSKGFLERAQSRVWEKGSSIKLMQGNAVSLAFPDESFDAVILSETLEHVSDERAAVNEAHRVLSKNGLLFFTGPNFFNFYRIDRLIRTLDRNVMKSLPGHLREYTKGKVRALLKSYFKIERFYPVPLGFDLKSRGGIVDRLIMKNVWGFSWMSRCIACVARKR